jgi:hypothetical protein
VGSGVTKGRFCKIDLKKATIFLVM